MTLPTSKEATLTKLNERARSEHAAETEKSARAGRPAPPEPTPLKAEQIEFPKWVHKGWKASSKGGNHETPSESRLVQSAEELKALGSEWSEEPPKVQATPKK